MNKDLYIKYPKLIEKLDSTLINVFFWLPFSLFFITTVQPVNVLYNPISTEVFHIIINYVCGDIWFYTIHRICHKPVFYFLHKQHHEVVDTIGILSLYAHPFDAIIINMGSMMTLHLLLHFSFFQIMLIGSVATISTIINSHTGRAKMSHQLHHIHKNCNYGTGSFMDVLMKTDRYE
jgi:sterol desaturase/sphingolipid hydroxylase (fatty acid hydroxylase superfamily)